MLFFLVVPVCRSRAFEIPFPKQNSGFKLKIYIEPSAGTAGSAVRIKKKRPKGKIVLQKRDQTEKKNGTKKQKTVLPGVEPGLSARESNSLTTAPQ